MLNQETSISNRRVGKRQYLVTYSQADLQKFPTRESFGTAVRDAFNHGASKVKVQHWVCSRENHQDGGVHYHCSVKLDGVKRWYTVKNFFQQRYGVVLNFSDSHNYYMSAYQYTCKSDPTPTHSPEHPDLSAVGSPRTKTCIAAYRRKRQSSDDQGQVCCSSSSVAEEGELPTSNPKKAKRLSSIEVSDFIVKHRLYNKTELYAMAQSRKDNGECDLAAFLFSRNEKFIVELIQKTWAMNEASSKMVRESRSRMELVRDAAQSTCSTELCEWLECALEVLQFNSINPHTFGGYLKELLQSGRGKWKNLMIIGETNCAKTFLLKPLKIIFKCFENPSNDKYAWVGANDAEIILMQDFRWSKETIAWKDLLLLLEGETVKLPAPKNHFTTDVEISSDVPIFATGKEKIKFRGPYNASDDRENAMMDSRWRYIKLTHVFEESDQKKIAPCAKCFAKLVLMGE